MVNSVCPEGALGLSGGLRFYGGQREGQGGKAANKLTPGHGAVFVLKDGAFDFV
jgi:hypothetical protein